MITEETIVTYAPNGNVNPDVIKTALESILGTQAKSTSDSNNSSNSSSGSSSPASSSDAPSPADIQQRIEAFRSRFGGGGGPGALLAVFADSGVVSQAVVVRAAADEGGVDGQVVDGQAVADANGLADASYLADTNSPYQTDRPPVVQS